MQNGEIHRNLRGGKGIVTTYTKKLFKGQFIILVLDSESSIGMHKHRYHSEIYITLNRGIRFCGNKRWKIFNYCKKGNSHSAENTSKKEAKIYAFKV